MGLFTAGRAGPGVLGRVLRTGGLAAAAAAPLTAVLVFSAGPALAAGGDGPTPWPCAQNSIAWCSPVIIDVDGSGYHLTSAAGGVLFDFGGRGHLVRVAWTAPGSSNAFLVLPRNGRVDDGSELFGNLTPQPASARPNGFAALAVWDQPGHGGNGDAIIDPADAIWPRLRLWQDTDHDGKVQPGELHTLAAFGITGISVRYRAVGGADRYGNRYGYATAVDGSGPAAAIAYDFFLTTAPAGPPSPNGWPIAAGAAAAGAAALTGAALAIRRRRRPPRRRAPIPAPAGQATDPEPKILASTAQYGPAPPARADTPHPAGGATPPPGTLAASGLPGSTASARTGTAAVTSISPSVGCAAPPRAACWPRCSPCSAARSSAPT
jgi:hypothetical protein